MSVTYYIAYQSGNKILRNRGYDLAERLRNNKKVISFVSRSYSTGKKLREWYRDTPQLNWPEPFKN